MRREKLYRVGIGVSRAIRWLGWTVAAVYAGSSFDGLHRMLGNGSVGVGTSAFTTAELMAVLIIALAYDRTWELTERSFRDKLTRTA